MKGLYFLIVLLIGFTVLAEGNLLKPTKQIFLQTSNPPTYGGNISDLQKYFEQNLSPQLLEKSFVRLIFSVAIEANGTVTEVNPINHPLEIGQEAEVVKLISGMKWNQMESDSHLNLILVITNRTVTVEIC